MRQRARWQTAVISVTGLPCCAPNNNRKARPKDRTHSRAILPDVSTERNRPLVGVGVVFIRDGRVFLAKRRGSHGEATWASAGGHLEHGESLEDCARREAREELGVDVGEVRILCFSNILAYDRHYIDVEFLGDIGNQEPVPNKTDGTLAECGWFPLREPPEPLFEPMRLAIASLLSGNWYYPAGAE